MIEALLFFFVSSSHAIESTRAFPIDFLWGSATSAYQIEGGIEQNDWAEWERGGHTLTQAGRATDHYHRFREDLDWAKNLGHTAFRMSIEWSRVEPEEGRFDEAEIAHYREVLTEARARGLKTMVTLHHFTNPIWLARKGDWRETGSIQYFARYARRMARELKDVSDFWLTFNEPSVVPLMGYLIGEYPPGLREPKLAVRVMANLLLAHAEAFHAIKEESPGAFVSIAHNVKVIDPDRSWNPLDRFVAQASSDLWNEQIPRAIATGRIHLHAPFLFNIDIEAPRLKDAWDFIGVNYYTRDFVRFDLFSPNRYRQVTRPGLARSDVGWEIYPEGLERVLAALSRYGKPLFVTESGLADSSDRKRAAQICGHVRAIARAKASGIQVLGYLHWSLLDNYEWSLGFGPRFGLIEVDYADGFRRTPRMSAGVLRTLIQSHGIFGCESL